MDCKDMSELISAYLDQELSDDETSVVRTHLSDCESCQVLLRELESLSVLARNAFSNLSAPDSMETVVMQQIASIRQSKQGFWLVWVAVYSVSAMVVVSIVGGLAAGGSFFWALLRLTFHLVHGINVLLLRLILGQGWLVTGTMVIGGVITVISIAGIRRLMREPLDPRFGSS